MEWNVTVSAQQGRLTLELSCQWVGKELLLSLTGGPSPHIGCVVMASSRPSLKYPGKLSATSSVLNLPGHQDEVLCRPLAEGFAEAFDCVVVCTGGVHVDEITADELSWFTLQVSLLGKQAIEELLNRTEFSLKETV